MKKVIFTLISIFLFVNVGTAEIVDLTEYDLITPLGSWWTYDYTYPDGIDDFTVNITEVESGQFEGKLRRGDYHEYHPSDPESRWTIYEVLEQSAILYEDTGTIYNPPIVFDENFKLETELNCYLNCSVFPGIGLQPLPGEYVTRVGSTTVPAGSFTDVIAKFSIDSAGSYPPNSANSQYGLNPTEVPYAVTHIRWYAKGVGLIKCVDINSGDGSIVHQYELKSYNVSGSRTAYIPHITGGGSEWNDYLDVDNLNTSEATYHLTLYGVDGSVVYSDDLTVAGLSRSTVLIKELNSVTNTAATGKITYTESKLNFRLSYRYAPGGGVAQFKLTDTLSSKLGFFFSDFMPTLDTKALALTNFGTTPANVTIEAIGNGLVNGAFDVTIEPNQRLVGVYQDFFDLDTSQVQTIRATSSTPTLSGVVITSESDLDFILFTVAEPFK